MVVQTDARKFKNYKQPIRDATQIEEDRGLEAGIASLLSHPIKQCVRGGLGNLLESIMFPNVLFFCIEELGFCYKFL